MFRLQRLFFVAVVLNAPALLSEAWAQAAAPQHNRFNELLSELARQSLPDAYQDKDDWGKTRRMWDGLHVQLKGLRLRTKRRWKDAKHGTWKMYRITPVDPERHLHVGVQNLRAAPGGKVAFDVVGTARLHGHARFAEWQYDVQLASIGVEAEAVVDITLTLEVDFDTLREGLLPVVVIQPEATAADVRLREFELQCISRLDGPLVRELGEELEDIIQRQIDRQRSKLLAKINQQLDRRGDNLRLSLADYLTSGWNQVKDFSEAALPEIAE